VVLTCCFFVVVVVRFANPAWAELDLSQADCAYIFSKLRMTAKQFASTLNEAATAGIHMKGDGNIFSYYSLGDFVRPQHPSTHTHTHSPLIELHPPPY
jgi:hypothetical protein